MQTETIRSLTKIQLGYQFRSKPEGDENGSVALIQIKDILPNRSGIDWATPLLFEPDRDPTKQLLQEGDVLFMGKGSAPFACTVRGVTGPTVAGGMFYILRPDTRRVLPDYLAWVLSNEQTLEKLKIASGTGVAMPVIRRSELEKLKIPVPPLETQQRIGELQELSRREMDLVNELAEQKQILAEGVCKKLMEGYKQ
jgi:restriction endonuclease S subunit